LAVKERFLLDLRVGPRNMEHARQLAASVRMGVPDDMFLPLLLIDDHLPYPQAILDVFGQVKHRRRRRGRGRRKHPKLKPPPNLQVGVVKKQRDERGNLIRVRTKALFGVKKEIERRIRKLGIGQKINTSHLERLNGTIRGQQARLARRTRNGSRRKDLLQKSLWLWRDLYNWTRIHYSLWDQTPAMAMGLAEEVWSVRKYVLYPVHVSELQRMEWSERRNDILESAVEVYNREKCLPIS
jgi:hypothetical protein